MGKSCGIVSRGRDLLPEVAALRNWKPLCSKCGKSNRRAPQRYCHDCHSANMRARRAMDKDTR